MLGGLGVGCNPGITRFMKNTLFDEKIDGTIHLALGTACRDRGTNQAIDWDIVKDLRPGPSDLSRRRGRAGKRRLDDLKPADR